MIALDTNVLVRWVLRDDGAQAAVADRLLSAPFYVSPSVLVELGWVLQSVGGMERTALAFAVSRLMHLPTAHTAHADQLRWAIERFSTRGDWADLVHIASCTAADGFASFDKPLAADAGPNSPLEIVRADSQARH